MAFSPARLPFYSPSLPTPSPSIKGSSTSTSPGTVPTRILLLSDTHQTALFPPNDRTHAFKAPLPRADVVLHAGDLSNTGIPDQLAKTFNVLASIEAEFKLVIAGNHDLTLDADFWRHGPFSPKNPTEEQNAIVEEQIRSAKEMWTGKEARKKGIRYLEEGVHEFELTNGAKFRIYASPYSPEFCNWAFMTPLKEDRYNADQAAAAYTPANPIPDHPDVDLVMTHGPPLQILDRTHSRRHVGCEHLLRALPRVRPRLHVFGHIHEDWGVMRVNWGTRKGECLNVTGRSNASADPGEEDEEAWDRVVERGYVAVDLTNGALGGVKKGRVKEEESEEDAGNKNGVVALPPLEWGLETLCVNASIMATQLRPINAPIVVDLMLPSKTSGGQGRDSDGMI